MELTKGTKVIYKPCFGLFEPKQTTITYIQKSEFKRCKYGKIVDSVPYKDKDYCVFGLSDGHWCYGEQIINYINN